MEPGVLLRERFASGKQWIHDRLEHGIACDQLSNPACELLPRHDPDLQPKRTKKAPYDLLCGGDRTDHMLTSCRKCPRLLAADTLDVNRLEPAGPHDLCDSPSVIPIGLHRHGGQGSLDLTRFQADGRQSELDEVGRQPLRDRSCLKADPFDLTGQWLEIVRDRRRIRRWSFLPE